jgi:hypothetical protein
VTFLSSLQITETSVSPGKSANPNWRGIVSTSVFLWACRCEIARLDVRPAAREDRPFCQLQDARDAAKARPATQRISVFVFANSAHLLDGGDLHWRVANEPSDALAASQHVGGGNRLGVAPTPASCYRPESGAATKSPWLQ